MENHSCDMKAMFGDCDCVFGFVDEQGNTVEYEDVISNYLDDFSKAWGIPKEMVQLNHETGSYIWDPKKDKGRKDYLFTLEQNVVKEPDCESVSGSVINLSHEDIENNIGRLLHPAFYKDAHERKDN